MCVCVCLCVCVCAHACVRLSVCERQLCCTLCVCVCARERQLYCTLSLQKSWTALMYAVNSKHTRVVKEMLLAGADASARDKVSVPPHPPTLCMYTLCGGELLMGLRG